MKKTLCAIALATSAVTASAQGLQSEGIPYFSNPTMLYDGIIGKDLKWNAADKKIEYTGSTAWYDFNSILFKKDGGITFASGYNWQSPLKGFTNNKISQTDFEDQYSKMTIARTGEVGIGTSSPTAQLQIVGTVNSKGLVLTKKTTTKNKSIFICEDVAGWGYNQSSIKGDFGIFWNDGFVRNKDAGLVIGPHADSKGMRIDAKGNVGIGTNLLDNKYNSIDDYFKLAVKGSIRAEEIVVETDWADFVFDNSFRLKTLTEVEKFIEVNKHLPDVPPASHIESEGVKVGEMQKIHMQKIEELMLYTIQQDKELKNQKNLIDQLIKKIELIDNSN